MTNLFNDLDYVLVYLDDILIIQREGESEEDHLNKIDVVLTRLKEMDFRATLIRKSFFMQKEIEYLGYTLTTEGVKPQKKKVEAMKRIKRPTTPKQLRTFLGLVDFYRDVCRKRSHILAPLSKLSSVKPKDWTWGREQENAFRKIKEV